MQLNNRYTRALLMLATSLLLAGAQHFNCEGNTAGNSGGNAGGNTGGVQIRVSNEQKISADSGAFNGDLNDGDQFGSALTDSGDLDADGIRDLVVGAPFDDDGGNDRGALWTLFMNNNGSVDQEQKISSNAGGFNGNLVNNDLFGSTVTNIGDLDGDAIFDLAVGAPGSDQGGTDQGAAWVLFRIAGGVRQEQEIADSTGGFGGNLANGDRFGSAVVDIGDVNGDGFRDLAVGAPDDDDGSTDAGAIWILMMRANGQVDSWQKISRDEGGFNGNVNANDRFGTVIASVGDLDNNNVPDLAVGAPNADSARGAVWILFLDNTGRVRQEQEIADGTGGFGGNLDNNDRFGSAIASVGDIDGDGTRDLAVGAPNDDDGSADAGAVWILTMRTGGRVASWQKISRDEGGFNGNLSANDRFGSAIAGVGDLDNDGIPDLAVGAPGDDDGGTDQGAIWMLFMDR